MEINSQFEPVFTPVEAERLDPESGLEAAAPGGAPEAVANPAPAGNGVELRDPLECRLAELVQGKDLDDPQVFSSTSRLILQEILSSVFAEGLLNGLDRKELLDTFQNFIQDDPSMKEVLERFLQSLAGNP